MPVAGKTGNLLWRRETEKFILVLNNNRQWAHYFNRTGDINVDGSILPHDVIGRIVGDACELKPGCIVEPVSIFAESRRECVRIQYDILCEKKSILFPIEHLQEVQRESWQFTKFNES